MAEEEEVIMEEVLEETDAAVVPKLEPNEIHEEIEEIEEEDLTHIEEDEDINVQGEGSMLFIYSLIYHHCCRCLLK